MKKLFVIGILVLIVVGICMENAGAQTELAQY